MTSHSCAPFESDRRGTFYDKIKVYFLILTLNLPTTIEITTNNGLICSTVWVWVVLVRPCHIFCSRWYINSSSAIRDEAPSTTMFWWPRREGRDKTTISSMVASSSSMAGLQHHSNIICDQSMMNYMIILNHGLLKWIIRYYTKHSLASLGAHHQTTL